VETGAVDYSAGDGEQGNMTTLEATTLEPSTDPRRYHHGDLPNALRSAACDVIAERGLGNFSLREVARRAGVSHTAPAHHFGDMQGLLTSLAVEGFRMLTDGLTAALAGVDDPVERLVALGQAYFDFSTTHAAHCEVMFRPDVTDDTDEQLAGAGMHAYALLDDTVRGLIESEQLDVDPDVVTAMCWSSVQGLVVLSPKLTKACDARNRPQFVRPELLRQFTLITVNGLRSYRT
jgi:AcrR family transcriptional regulator